MLVILLVFVPIKANAFPIAKAGEIVGKVIIERIRPSLDIFGSMMSALIESIVKGTKPILEAFNSIREHIDSIPILGNKINDMPQDYLVDCIKHYLGLSQHSYCNLSK